MDKENFQKVLKLLRIICHVSAAEISEELGISEESYHSLENGELVPTESEVAKIAAFYNTTIDKLLEKDMDNFYIRTDTTNDKTYILSFSEKLLLLFFRRTELIFQDKARELVMQSYFDSDENCRCENIGIEFSMKSDRPTALINDEPSLIKAFRKIPDKNIIFRFLTSVNERIECADEKS